MTRTLQLQQGLRSIEMGNQVSWCGAKKLFNTHVTMGHWRVIGDIRAMSALPPKSDQIAALFYTMVWAISPFIAYQQPAKSCPARASAVTIRNFTQEGTYFHPISSTLSNLFVSNTVAWDGQFPKRW
jgi:hypothetical protein